ncbi:enoyl-CoA hydratase/isomerase [Acephala macrosclerotiorum]|nr:enoyl-CoA hydratase/isomerase [Acephala macrosclerotiorum]
MPPTRSPPPPTSFLQISYPAERVVLATMSREKDLNCMNTSAHWEMDAFWKWLDNEPSLSVAIITGAGKKAFSAGADLKEWNDSMKDDADPRQRLGNAPAFKPLSRRLGKKPVIAAVNGLAMGAGTEFAVNCDLVIAADTAYFALPEVKRGVSPIGGALPRIIRTLGLQRASEFALTGRNVTAKEAFEWGLVNKVVPQDQVVLEAVRFAEMIAASSPDAIICTRAGLREGWETAAVERAVEITLEREFMELQRGENILEGLKAFTEKRKPQWKASKL